MNEKRILILEDEEDSLFIIKAYLLKQKFQVEASKTVSGAIALLDSNLNFDLFIVDYYLPDGSGVDLIDQIKSRNIESPVIMCSAYSNLETEVLSAGVNKFISKPIEMSVLGEAIRNLL